MLEKANPFDNNHLARIAVWFIGIDATILIAGILVLEAMRVVPDAALFTLGGTALGGLTGYTLGNQQQRSNQSQRAGDPPSGTPADPIVTETTGPDKGPVAVVETPKTGEGGE